MLNGWVYSSVAGRTAELNGFAVIKAALARAAEEGFGGFDLIYESETLVRDFSNAIISFSVVDPFRITSAA